MKCGAFLALIALEHSIRSHQMSQLLFSIQDQAGDMIFFKIKGNMEMGRVFQACAKRKGMKRKHLRFLLDGDRIGDYSTPDSLELTDCDRLDVIYDRCGC